VQTVIERHLLDHEAEGGDVVGAGHRLAVLEVDLVLARNHLVMRRLDLESHGLQHDLMSDSSMRVNPSIDEPSNMIWPSSTFSNWLRGICYPCRAFWGLQEKKLSWERR